MNIRATGIDIKASRGVMIEADIYGLEIPHQSIKEVIEEIGLQEILSHFDVNEIYSALNGQEGDLFDNLKAIEQ